jgi:DNA-binding phage protein
MNLGTITKRTKVIQVFKDGELVDEVNGISNVARKYGVKVQNIYKTINGYPTTLNGYEFKLKV